MLGCDPVRHIAASTAWARSGCRAIPHRYQAAIGAGPDRAVAHWQNAAVRDQGWRTIGSMAIWSVVPVLAGAYVVAVIIGPIRPSPVMTSFALLSPALATMSVATGVGLLLAGSLAWLFRRRATGLIAIAAGICWFGPDWAGHVAAPTPLRAIGLGLGSLTLPLLAHMTLRMTHADVRRAVRVTLAALYLGTALLAIAWLGLHVPRLDPRCLALCDQGPLTAFGDHRMARELARALAWLTIATGLGLASWSLARLARSSQGAPRGTVPILAPAIGVGLAWMAGGVVSLQSSSVAPPTGAAMITVFVAQATSALLLSIGVAWALAMERRTLGAVRAIAHRLTPMPGGGSLRPALAAALGDPGLRLLFPLPGSDQLVDPEGRPSAPPEGAATPIEHDGRVVAVAVRSEAVRDQRTTVDLGAAVRLAAANESLLAAVRHEVVELRASRARIVTTGDDERRRLERDLHDGAQQRLLAVLYELSLARDLARSVGDAEASSRLARLTDDADSATEALRHIARGIHQAVLTEAGLVAALDVLMIEAPIPVTIDAPPIVVCSPATESTALRVDLGHPQPGVAPGSVGSVRARVGVSRSSSGQHRSRRSIGRARPRRTRGSGRGERRACLDVVAGAGQDGLRHGAAMRVIVAEDVLITRTGIVRILDDAGIDVVAETEDAASLPRLVDTLSPDAVVLDIRMPPTRTDEGLVAATRLREEHPTLAVLLLSHHVESRYAMQLLEGRDQARVGYLLKQRVFHAAVLVDALRRVCEGEVVLDPTIVTGLMNRKRRVDPLAPLSPREREVLALVGEGLSNRGIAQRLDIAERTVEAHMAQIFGKLGIEEAPEQHRRVLAVLTLLRA